MNRLGSGAESIRGKDRDLREKVRSWESRYPGIAKEGSDISSADNVGRFVAIRGNKQDIHGPVLARGLDTAIAQGID